jgi:hypothetical protein
MLSQHQSRMRSPPDLETENRQLNAARPRSLLQGLSVEGWSDIRLSHRRDPTRAAAIKISCRLPSSLGDSKLIPVVLAPGGATRSSDSLFP